MVICSSQPLVSIVVATSGGAHAKPLVTSGGLSSSRDWPWTIQAAKTCFKSWPGPSQHFNISQPLGLYPSVGQAMLWVFRKTWKQWVYNLRKKAAWPSRPEWRTCKTPSNWQQFSNHTLHAWSCSMWVGIRTWSCSWLFSAWFSHQPFCKPSWSCPVSSCGANCCSAWLSHQPFCDQSSSFPVSCC